MKGHAIGEVCWRKVTLAVVGDKQRSPSLEADTLSDLMSQPILEVSQTVTLRGSVAEFRAGTVTERNMRDTKT